MIQPMLGKRQADQSPAVLGHEIDRFRRDVFRRKREITLVLAITVVDNNQQAAAPELLQRLLDGYEGHNRILSGCLPRLPLAA